MKKLAVLVSLVLVGAACGGVPAEEDAGVRDAASSDAWTPPDAGCAIADEDGDGHDSVECGGDDCDDEDALRFPGATEVCDPDDRDEDCDPSTTVASDADEDGHGAIECGGDDCDDEDALRYPGAAEVCDAESRDEDCNPATYGARDADGDGHVDAACCNGASCGDDCDDARADVFAGTTEACDGADNDCDGAIDEGAMVAVYADADGDGYGTGAPSDRCPGTAGFATVAGDCDDATPAVSPGATELCADGIDNDCDGSVDESGPRSFYRDADDDGYGNPGDSISTSTSCTPPAGYADNSRDCNDAAAAIHPGAADPCDGLDNDCSIPLSGGLELAEDRDGDLHAPPSATCSGGFPKDDCNDASAQIHGGAIELCDGLDNDCGSGGGTDSGEDADGDRHSPPSAACTGGSYPANDCNDASATIYGGAPELCDRIDNDCSGGGGVDPTEDMDGDGHAPAGTMFCSGGPFPRDDCRDADSTVHPGAPELCDRIDSDCSSGGGVEAGEDADEDGRAPLDAACSGGFARDDCNDAQASVYPGAPERCDGLDNDCSSGGGAEPAEDMDGDGHSPPSAACTDLYRKDDCDDADATIYGGAPELCDRLDNDCSSGGGVEPAEDVDGDGHAPAGTTLCADGPLPRDDCRDADPAIYPGAIELCDRVDSDCSNGGGVELTEDADDDGHAPPGAACSGGSLPRDDCEDGNAAAYPGAPLGAPGPLGPQNGALSGSFRAPGTLRPTFRWLPASCAATETFEIEVDDSCSVPGFASCTFPSPEVRAGGLAGTSYRPASDLAVAVVAPVGRRYFWRVRACEGAVCAPWSAVRWVDVGRAPGDLNGDGYTDLVVGAPYQDAGATSEGNAFVYLGGPAGMPASPSVTLDNPDNNEGGHFGLSVASAGDLNGDGYADLVVGAFDQDTATAANAGKAFVYLGGPAGVATSPSITLESPRPGVGGSFGYSVASAGDLNGDGYGDLVVGARLESPQSAHVYLGGPAGVATMPSLSLSIGGGWFGNMVASAGDLNGDGYGDLIIGAPWRRAPALQEGGAFVYLGGASGVAASPSVTLDNPANQEGGHFGISVASAGDLNGDGYSDLAVGAQRQDAGATDEGSAFVYLGGPGGVFTAPSVTLDNPANQESGLFGYRVASAGDLNGDGYADLVVGAPYQDAGATDEGNAFVYLGGAAGISTSPSLTLDNPANQEGGGFGWSVASAGDLNADGYADLFIGAPYQDAGATDEGNAFVYLGEAAGLATSPSVTLDNPENQAGARFGNSVCGGL